MKNIPVTHLFHKTDMPLDLQKVFLREYAANGIKHIVLSDTMISRIMANSSERFFYKDLAGETDLVFTDAHAPFGTYVDMNCPIPELRKEKILRARLAMEIASEFGIESMTFHVGSPRHPGYTMEELHAEALRTIEELLPYAEKCGLILCIENSWYPTATADKLLDIKNHFSTDTLGFCFDSGHAHIAECAEFLDREDCALVKGYALVNEKPQTEKNTLEKMLPHIVNCHLHDNSGLKDDHMIPGHGTIDWEKIISTLSKAPRLKCIQNEALEPFYPQVTPGASIRKMAENFESILKTVQ